MYLEIVEAVALTQKGSGYNWLLIPNIICPSNFLDYYYLWLFI